MARTWWWVALGLIVALPASADQWEKTFTVGTQPALTVSTDDGNVSIEPWDKKSIAVRVTTASWRIGSDVKIEERQVGDHVEVRVHRTPRWGIDINFGGSALKVEVSVPRRTDLNVETGDGNIGVRAVEGRIGLHTGDGRIDADRLRGELSLSSGDGSISASDLDGTLRVHTGDGRVSIGGRFDAVDLSSGDGSVSVEARHGSRIGDGWSVKTGDGSVDLRIPSDLDATLDANTGDGGIRLDLPVRVAGDLSHHAIRGQLNRGGPVLRVRTGDGSIRIGESAPERAERSR
jgi:DUF4097 and DUF4098 domain-containing protein YvlB